MPCSQHLNSQTECYIHDIDPSSLLAHQATTTNILGDNDEILARFHILLIVYLQSAPFSMLDSLICHVGAMYNKSIFSCICQVMKTPQ